MPEAPFAVPITVRGYELDGNGHVNGRSASTPSMPAGSTRAAGIDYDDLLAAGVGPVTLQETIRYHRALRGGDEVIVFCAFVWGDGKTFSVEQTFRDSGGVLVAELSGVWSVMDSTTRRLAAPVQASSGASWQDPEPVGLIGGHGDGRPFRPGRTWLAQRVRRAPPDGIGQDQAVPAAPDGRPVTAEPLPAKRPQPSEEQCQPHPSPTAPDTWSIPTRWRRSTSSGRRSRS